jgi:hypothetical protein
MPLIIDKEEKKISITFSFAIEHLFQKYVTFCCMYRVWPLECPEQRSKGTDLKGQG